MYEKKVGVHHLSVGTHHPLVGRHAPLVGTHHPTVGTHHPLVGTHPLLVGTHHPHVGKGYPTVGIEKAIIRKEIAIKKVVNIKYIKKMASKRKLSEVAQLEQYRIALENVSLQPEIAAIMAEFGYDETVITEGKTLLNATRAAFDFNKKEDDESTEAYADFFSLKEELTQKFILDRKKAKVVFKNEPIILSKLAINGSIPDAYINWLETIKKFYSESNADTTIKTKLARLKITPEDLTATLQQIDSLEAKRTAYLREKGESQDATKKKDTAFGNLEKWMSEFYAVAKIALIGSPQLLESIGKFVRS